jgi:4-amino-4-deoxy-L-arabinose transferase-like glycosyltransferase
MERATPIESKGFSPTARIFAIVVALLLGGAAFWGANKQALGLFHDDAIYTVVAKSIAQGDGYRIISLPTAPPQTKYPFLYSYVLAGFWALDMTFPHNIIVLKSLNVAIIVALFFTSLVFYRRYFPASSFGAVIFALLVCTNPIVFTFTDYVTSDLLFALFALVTLTMCTRGREAPMSMPRATLLGIVTGAACLTRLAAAPLVLAGGLYSLIRRGWRGALWFAAIVTLIVMPWLLWSSRSAPAQTNSLFAYYAAYDFGIASLQQRWGVMVSNAQYLVDAFGLLYLLPLMPGLGIFVVVLTAVGIIKSLRRDDLVIWSFFLFSVALLLFWPFQPARYVAPLVPVIILLLFRGAQALEVWCDSRAEQWPLLGLLRKLVWVPLLLVLVLNGVWLSSYLLVRDEQTTRGLYGSHMRFAWRGFEESFEWLREHVPSDARLATAYDPMYYLYTGRQAIRPALHRPITYFYPYGASQPDVGSVQEVMPELDKLGIRYLVIDPLDGYAEGKATLTLLDGLVAAYGDRATNVFTSSDGKHKIYLLTDR